MKATIPFHFVLTLSLLGIGSQAVAQHQHQSGYAGMESRDIKALSPEQIADLREGRGMGASLPAELNGIPGPLHVLQLKGQLHVTPEQQVALERITAEMKAYAQRLGQQVIAAESALDQAFRAGTADETVIHDATGRIASLNGELRAVHLVAHLKTKRLLSDQQVLAYNEARGYGVPGSSDHKH
jgi:hypothetical protein